MYRPALRNYHPARREAPAPAGRAQRVGSGALPDVMPSPVRPRSQWPASSAWKWAAGRYAQHSCHLKLTLTRFYLRGAHSETSLQNSSLSLMVQMILETGEIGRQANGAVNLTYGDTVSVCTTRLFTATFA